MRRFAADRKIICIDAVNNCVEYIGSNKVAVDNRCCMGSRRFLAGKESDDDGFLLVLREQKNPLEDTIEHFPGRMLTSGDVPQLLDGGFFDGGQEHIFFGYRFFLAV